MADDDSMVQDEIINKSNKYQREWTGKSAKRAISLIATANGDTKPESKAARNAHSFPE